MDPQTRYARRDGVTARPLHEGGVLYWAERERLFVLNETGYLIWQLCDGTRSPGQIAEAVTREFEVDGETARRDVAGYVAKLLEVDLLQPAPVAPALG